jgi:multidrug efflux pump
MSGITDFALKNSRTVILLQALIIFVGILIFPSFPKLEDPPIIIREAVVTAYFPGMSPDRVERLITRPIEEEIRTMGVVDNIKNSSTKLKSTSKFGESIVHVVVKDDIPSAHLATVWKRLRNKMNDVKSKLPEGTIGPNVNDEFGDTAVATIALQGEGMPMSEMRELARTIRERLITLQGILKVDLYGVQDQRIYLDFSNSKLAELGLSLSTIRNAIQQQNVVLPSGRLDIDGTELIVEPSGKFKTVKELSELLIPLGKNLKGKEQTIALRDIASIREGYIDPLFQPVYYNGKSAIILSVCLLPGVDAVGFGKRLNKKIAEITKNIPLGYTLEYATFQPDLITKAVNSMVINVIESLIIVLVVVILLLGFRTGMIVGSFIPLVMLSGLISMKFIDIEMQRMSLAAMIIALGMLVDNGICVAEEITTRMQMGTPRRDAVIKTGQLLAVPLLTSTLTTVLAFCPMFLQDGGAGDYTKSLGLVITVLLLASWFLSMFSTTSACNWFMKVKPLERDAAGDVPDPYTGKLYQFYKGILVWMLGHRLVVLLAVAGALALSAYGFTFVTQTFFPPGDRNQYLMYLDFPAGIRIEKTDKVVRKIAKWLEDKKINPEITGTSAYVGSGGPRFFLSLAPDDPDTNYAFIIVNTKTAKQVPEMLTRTREYLLKEVPEVRGRIKQMWLGSTETGLMEIRFSGRDKDLLLEQAEQLMAVMRDVPGMVDIKQDWNNRVIRMKIDVDQKRARRAGLTTQEVADSMNVFISGNTVSDFYFGYTDIPIVARGLKSERNAMDSLFTMGIFAKAVNKNVPLVQIADIYGKGEYDRIKRYNQAYTVIVSCKHQTLAASQIFQQIKPFLDKMDFPPGHFWELGGELEESAKSQKRLAKWFPICFLFIVALLVWQFNSFRRAGIIILTMPLVFVGAVVGMLVMQADFGFMVILGLLSLAGSIVNNGIVLIDRIETFREEGQETYDAIVNSCVNRLRPIFLSVSTTALGILTLIFPYNPLFYGMASVIIFGLLIGTVFTLGFVPVLYSLFFRVKIPAKS